MGIKESRLERRVLRLRERLPLEVKHRLGALLDVKSWKIEANKAAIELEQKRKMIKKYQFFLSHEWICSSNKSIDAFNSLAPEEQALFNFNVNSINWKVYSRLCVYAIKKHLLNHHVEDFKADSMDLLSRKEGSYFNDIVWALSVGKPVQAQKWEEVKSYVLSSKSVKEAIKALVE